MVLFPLASIAVCGLGMVVLERGVWVSPRESSSSSTSSPQRLLLGGAIVSVCLLFVSLLFAFAVWVMPS